MMIETNDASNPKRLGNALIGERIHTLMWRQGRTQKELAAILHVDQGSVSNRLRGKTAWSAIEVSAVAAWLQTPITELLPEVEITNPDPEPWVAGGGDPDGAPTRARTWDLRINSPICT